jgi:hypothetical protein
MEPPPVVSVVWVPSPFVTFSEQPEEVLFEDDAQDEQDRDATAAQTAAAAREPESRPFTAPVLDVDAPSAWCPTHAGLLFVPRLRSAAGLLLDFRPVSAQRNGAVEDGPSRYRVAIDAEVPETFELPALARFGGCERWLKHTFGAHDERVPVEVREPIFSRATSSGSFFVKSRSYNRTSPATACAAETQWSVAFGLRPSGESPPRVAGSYVQRSSTTSPSRP